MSYLSILPIALAVTAALGGAVSAAEVSRVYASPQARFASSVTVPADADLVFLSGALAPPAAGSPPGSADRTTEGQTDKVLRELDATLKTQGLSLGDVVAMHVYLAGDPAKGGAMDFAGLNAAYARAFGTPAQPNRPTRAAVQVAALAVPGALVEIEVTAARPHHR